MDTRIEMTSTHRASPCVRYVVRDPVGSNVKHTERPQGEWG